MAVIKGLNGIQQFQPNPIHALPVGDNPPEEVNMIVETPMDSINKFELHNESGLIKLDRVLFEKLQYPVEYGAIPQTWDDDNDPLDVMCLVTYPTFPGCIVSIRPVGIMLFEDAGETDDKILAVPVDDIRFKEYDDISDFSEHRLDEIAFFFERYKDLQFKYKGETDMHVKNKGWKNKKAAFEIIKKAEETYKKKFGKK